MSIVKASGWLMYGIDGAEGTGVTGGEESGTPACCVTVNRRPAMTSVDWRAGPVFASMVYAAVPLPVAPDGVAEIQSASPAAAQLQPDAVVTDIVPVAPTDGALMEPEELSDAAQFELPAAPKVKSTQAVTA
jgi:hypothetical protein